MSMAIMGLPRTCWGFALLMALLITSAVCPAWADVVFVGSGPACASTPGTCNGSLQKPFATITDALNALDSTVISTIVLMPGTHTGAGNRGINVSDRILTIRARDPQSTLIDCEGAAAFASMSYGYYTLNSLTVQNCGSGSASAMTISNGVLFIDSTRWVSNSGATGAAIRGTTSSILMVGSSVNTFNNNAATTNGGALGLSNSDVTLNGYEVFSGNSVGGSTTHNSANIYASSSSIWYPPGGSAPPRTVGTATVYPVTYVDPAASCGSSCSGSQANPFTNLQATISSGPAQDGGTIALKPGVYTGALNRNIQYSNTMLSIIQWPGTTGSIVIDCQNQGFGMTLADGNLDVSDVTFQNCTTAYAAGGGALRFSRGVLRLTNVHFLRNSASAGSGGALAVSSGAAFVYGGSFQQNRASSGGGALSLNGADMLIYDDTSFSNNQQDTLGTVGDTVCYGKSGVGTDGSPVFDTLDAGAGNCTITLSAPNTVAVFPGALNTDLYPLDASGTSVGSYGGIEFHSLVELDNSDSPIESTRISSHELSWTQKTQFNGPVATVRYDAFGPANQFVSVTQDFFTGNGTLLSNNHTFPEGTLKTTVEVALWSFASASNSLALILRTRSDTAVTAVTSEVLDDGRTQYTIATAGQVVMRFAVESEASYDPGLMIQAVQHSTWENAGVQYFQFIFSSFQAFVSFDPDMSVVLGGGGGGDGDGGGDGGGGGDGLGGSAADGGGGDNVGLIAGLTIGVVAAVVVVVGVIGVGTGVAMYLRHVRRQKLFSAIASGSAAGAIV